MIEVLIRFGVFLFVVRDDDGKSDQIVQSCPRMTEYWWAAVHSMFPGSDAHDGSRSLRALKRAGRVGASDPLWADRKRHTHMHDMWRSRREH